MYQEKTIHIAKFLASRMTNGMIRPRKRASSVTDHPIHGRANVVKLCDRSNRQCLHLSSWI